MRARWCLRLDAVGLAFRHNVDFAQLVKQYATDRSVGRYSPPTCTGARVRVDFALPHTTPADPDPRPPRWPQGIADHVWTMTETAALLD